MSLFWTFVDWYITKIFLSVSFLSGIVAIWMFRLALEPYFLFVDPVTEIVHLSSLGTMLIFVLLPLLVIALASMPYLLRVMKIRYSKWDDEDNVGELANKERIIRKLTDTSNSIVTELFPGSETNIRALYSSYRHKIKIKENGDVTVSENFLINVEDTDFHWFNNSISADSESGEFKWYENGNFIAKVEPVETRDQEDFFSAIKKGRKQEAVIFPKKIESRLFKHAVVFLPSLKADRMYRFSMEYTWAGLANRILLADNINWNVRKERIAPGAEIAVSVELASGLGNVMLANWTQKGATFNLNENSDGGPHIFEFTGIQTDDFQMELDLSFEKETA